MGLISLAAGSWWYEIWISIWLLICQGLYIFIGALYQVFEKVASVNLFSVEVFTEITSRIYIVMGIAMLFIFAYNLVLLIINPDEKKGSNNQMSKVVKETIISLALLVLLPTIFNYLYIFQTHVLESNIIGQVILGDVGTTSGDYSKCPADDYECKCDFSQFDELENYNVKVSFLFFWDYDDTVDKKTQLTNACKKYREVLTPSQRGAYSVAPTILSAFYRPTHFNYNDCEEYLQTGNSSLITTDEDKQICVNFYYDVNYSKYTGHVAAFSGDSYLKDIISDFDKDSMEFHWLMATVAGVLAVYMFFCYAMEIGVRVAKLGFLQLISPIPVMMRIIPGQKEKIFDKWLTQLKNTYLDVFIRLIIIFFCLFAISLVPDVLDTLFKSTTSGDGNFFVKALSMVFVILGILKFAGDAPALFKEFFGSSGAFALRSPLKQLSDNKLAMGGMGAIGGAVSTGVKNYNHAKKEGKSGWGSAIAGAGSGMVRGARAGAKSKDLSELRTNTSAAVDRALAARDARKARSEYVWKDDAGNELGRGTSAYYKARMADGWETFTSGESLEALQARKKATHEAFSAYKGIIDDTKNTIKENPSKYKISTDGGQTWTTIQQLQWDMERAQQEMRDFKLMDRIEELASKYNGDRVKAEKDARKEYQSYLNEAQKASTRYENAVDNLTDAVIKNTDRSDGRQKTNDYEKPNGEFFRVDGKFTDGITEICYKSDKEVTNLKQNIDKAHNTLSTLSNDIGEVAQGLNDVSKSAKDRRNALGSASATLDAQIANKAQKQNKSGK